ncbi:MAG: hypothetical protein BMS9Abin25_1420 [Gammaproteobacteria bacterium]|nr:MAG: hypothetical protein BMS9Abin25_1420 [Gammaproteobacteria bacterium]
MQAIFLESYLLVSLCYLRNNLRLKAVISRREGREPKKPNHVLKKTKILISPRSLLTLREENVSAVCLMFV